MRFFLIASPFVLLVASSAQGQPPVAAEVAALRYELGQRLKRFETAWEKHEGTEARGRALGHIEKITQQFFALQFGEAGRSLDRATFALATDDDPAASRQWAWSLYAVPEARVVDGAADSLSVTIKQLYAVKGDPPAGLEVQLWFLDKQITTCKPEKFPHTVKIPLPPLGEFKGLDRKLYVLVEAGKELRQSTIGVSQVANLEARLAALKKTVAGWKTIDTIEKATARERSELLADLAAGTAPETDLPAADLLANAEQMLDGKSFYTADKPGQFWLSVPTSAKTTTAARLFVPRGPKQEGASGEPVGGTPAQKIKLVPIVVALHGAGGSENLFFEGYGAGRIVAECRKRGWLLVAPRSGFGFGGAPPVPALLEQLAKRYPIDPKRVFLVGHSMGAMQTIDLVQKYPGTFVAAAALGGGGTVRDAKAFADLPLFVGVGERDGVALTMARGLNKSLAPSAKKLTYAEYPRIEHMAIVREALPDVFELFDQVAAEK